MIPINKRSIGLCMILSLITFGIYSIYWEYLLVKNTRAIKKDASSCTGEMLCLIFVPFYSLYWWFTRGKLVRDEFSKHGYSASSKETVFLVLALFGLGIVVMAIMQNDFNSLPSGSTQSDQRSAKSNTDALMNVVMVVASVLGVALAVVLFMYLPAKLFNLLNGAVNESITGLRALFEGILKITIFFVYMFLVSLTPDIKRTFMYHGAEHKTIFCYEKGLPLTVENIKLQSRFHPRCGTSFMIVMLVVGILFTFLIQTLFPVVTKFIVVWVIVKILMLPIICGLGYEFLRYCGTHNNAVTRILAAPGLWTQRITTKEPDDKIIEVAIAAMEEVIPEDGSDCIK